MHNGIPWQAVPVRKPHEEKGETMTETYPRSSGSRPDAATRLRILEGRRSRLEERVESFRGALARTRERVDSYTLELQKHGLESAEREVRWLSELIDDEHRRTRGEPTNTYAPEQLRRGTGETR